MRIPDSLATLFDYGILQDVVRPLMSGKEAQVYVVVSEGQYRVAKVYKEAENRSFKHRAAYTEGRKVRNSRDQRAMDKRSKHGRAQDEAAWRSTEVDMIHRLHAAGVRVPVPYHFVDGVLIMELILDSEGNPAPRLADLVFDPKGAEAMYERLLREVVRMLCAGVVHGDLSDFNVLVGADGPVLIDFPQAVDTAHNANARRILLRDVDNLHRFLRQFSPYARRLPYAEEMWELFQQNAITPDTRLTGRYRPSERRADMSGVLSLIQDANHDERKRREALGLRGGPAAGSAPPPPGPPRSARATGGGRGLPDRRNDRTGPQQPAPREGAPARPAAGGPPPERGASPADARRSNVPAPPRANGPRDNPPRHAGTPRDGGRSRGGPPAHGPSQGRMEPPRARPDGAHARGGAPARGGDGGRRGPVEVIVVRRPVPPREP